MRNILSPFTNEIIFISISVLFLLSCNSREAKQRSTSEDIKPNIIYIFTDQQHANMMSCAGNPWLKTPAMDYIAKNGVRFTRAYTTNPVCVPARVGMMTGRFPGEFLDNNGEIVRDNPSAIRIPTVSEEVYNTNMAAFLKKAGYDLIYGGKEHLPKPLRPDTLGFTDISDNERLELALTAADFIKTPHEKPYYMVLSFINPHDICYMGIRDFATTDFDHAILKNGKEELTALDSALQKPEGVSDEEFFARYCPPVPPNLEPQKGEPNALKALINNRPFRVSERQKYTDKDWRMHRYAYCRLTEDVDSQIQFVLNALKESGEEENTMVIFSSDHGDNDASHRLEHKSTLYEESANIPFLVMWKGHIPAGRVDSLNLISNGLDLLPTICDYAGIKAKADPRGRSLRPLLEGKQSAWRKTLGVESEPGRMIVSNDKLKYIQYDLAGYEEQLLDLNIDPWETTHFTDSLSHQNRLKKLRKIFETEWFPHKR